MKLFHSTGNSSRRRSLLLIVMVIAIAGALIVLLGNNKNKQTSISPKYASFNGNYLFTIPGGHIANGTAITGATIIYPEASPPKEGQSLNDLYASGVVAVQPIAELKNNDSKAFKAYTKNVLAADLRKNFVGLSDLHEAKQKDTEAAEVYALQKDGKRLRVDYAINFTQPVLVVTQDRSDTYKVVAFSMEDLNKSSLKPDIDRATETAKQVAQLLPKQDSGQLVKLATAKYKKETSEQQLSDSLKQSSQYLQRPINIVGGLYNGNDFVAQLVFQPSIQGQQPVVGIVSLHKTGKAWKLDGLQLPK